MGPGSAPQREGRCTASGTRAGAVHIALARRVNLSQARDFRFSVVKLAPPPKSVVYLRRPVPLEGRFAIVTSAGRDAVDADGALRRGRRTRTAKSCGPDASAVGVKSAEAIRR